MRDEEAKRNKSLRRYKYKRIGYIRTYRRSSYKRFDFCICTPEGPTYSKLRDQIEELNNRIDTPAVEQLEAKQTELAEIEGEYDIFALRENEEKSNRIPI